MSTHNISFYGGNYPRIITKYSSLTRPLELPLFHANSVISDHMQHSVPSDLGPGSISLAEWLALLTLGHRVPGSNLAGDRIQLISVRHFIAQSFIIISTGLK